MDNNKTIESLKEQYEHHKVMMIKALGAIEVLEQLEAEKDNPDQKPKKEDKK